MCEGVRDRGCEVLLRVLLNLQYLYGSGVNGELGNFSFAPKSSCHENNLIRPMVVWFAVRCEHRGAENCVI